MNLEIGGNIINGDFPTDDIEAWWHSGRASDSKLRGPGFDPPQVTLCCVLEQSTLTPQKAMASS